MEADPEADVNAKYAQIIDRGEQVSGMKKLDKWSYDLQEMRCLSLGGIIIGFTCKVNTSCSHSGFMEEEDLYLFAHA